MEMRTKEIIRLVPSREPLVKFVSSPRSIVMRSHRRTNAAGESFADVVDPPAAEKAIRPLVVTDNGLTRRDRGDWFIEANREMIRRCDQRSRRRGLGVITDFGAT